MPVYFFFTGEHPEYHTPKDRPETINYAGIAKVADMVDQLATTIATTKDRPEYVAGAGGSMGGRPGGPKLGLMPRYDGGGDGMEISGIMPGGAAEAAGLKKGDKITAIADKPVKTVQDYMAAMSGLKARRRSGDHHRPGWESFKGEGHSEVSLLRLGFSDLS